MDQAFWGHSRREDSIHDTDSHTTAGVEGFVQVDYHYFPNQIMRDNDVGALSMLAALV